MKISIVADAYAITSSIKKSDVEFLKKNCPDALKLKDEEDNDVFSIDYCAGKPAISKFGITFGGVSRDEKDLLTLTGTIPAGVDAKEYVADTVGQAVAYLNEIETNIPDVVKDLRAERKQLIDSITVA